MNKKTLTKLEYHKIIDILIEQATSFGGKERCKRLKPMTSITDIEAAQEQTAAAFTRIIKKGRPSFGSCNPVGESLKRLEVGAALGSGELLRICKLLENAGQIKAYGRHETVDDAEDCLDAFFQQIEPLTLVSTEIRRCIIDEDEISDDASSTLKQIRRSMNQINDKVHSTLSSLVNGSLRTYLQDAIITMRGDRYCIPVKAEYRSQVSGLIHDQSATGSTLFIEPMSVVKLNNDLKELSDRVNGKYSKPTNGIPKTDLDSSVQASLGKADTALQSHQSVVLATGTNNGTLKITVGGTATDNVTVKGLKSAAYTESSAMPLLRKALRQTTLFRRLILIRSKPQTVQRLQTRRKPAPTQRPL